MMDHREISNYVEKKLDMVPDDTPARVALRYANYVSALAVEFGQGKMFACNIKSFMEWSAER